MVAWDAPQGDTKESAIIPRVLGASSCEQKGRLGVAAGGGPFGRRTAIMLDLEQGKAPWLDSVPCLELSAAEVANLQLAIGVTAKQYDAGLRHGGRLSSVHLDGIGFLQTMQEIRRALGVRCGGKDRTLVIFEDLDP